MKKLLIALVMMGSLTTFAQDRKTKMEEFTPEQRVELHVKKMTLDLDLNEKQQSDIKKLLTEQNKKHEAARAKHEAAKESGKTPTPEERFAMRSKMMDEKIALKSEMKKILNEKQMERWEELKDDRMEHMQNNRKEMRHKSGK
jgi:periplasmic protein CpxP/Spy